MLEGFRKSTCWAMIGINMKKDNPLQYEIVPAFLPTDFDYLKSQINFVKKAIQLSAGYVQIDVVDGKFAPTKTWPYNQEDSEMWKSLKDQEVGLPNWERVNFEIDLMVMNQLEESLNWIDVGASRLIGHIEAFDKNFTTNMSLEEYTKLSQQANYVTNLNIEKLEKFLNLKNEYGVEIVLSLNPSTKLFTINPYLGLVDAVQFMGNDKIGYHGVELDENVLILIKELRLLKPSLPIGIDIGVNFHTLKKLTDAGVTRFSSGSTILKSENPEKTILDMLSVIKSS